MGARQAPLRRLIARLRKMLFAALLMAVLLSSLVVLVFRWVDPPTSAVMLQRAAVETATQEQAWVSFDQIDPQMALAVVAAEDQRFPLHWGFDTREIVAAVEKKLEGGELRGASTISQQVARNLFLWQGRSYLRKGLEAWFTLLVEALWPKQRILEVYLNLAEMGPRVFGIGAASAKYFGRPPLRLGKRRAALVAAVLPNPVVYRIDAPSAYVRQRRDWILGQMRNLGGTAYLDGLRKHD